MAQRLLLIMPNFFDYPQVICEELQKMGYIVDYFDDRPSTRSIIKAIIRINKKLISLYISNYSNKIINKIEKISYDYVLLISGQSLSFDENAIKKIKTTHPKAKFVLYQWDSLKNFPYIQKFHKYFDTIYSFDKKDVNNSEKMKFLPLFFSKKYQEIANNSKWNTKYDFSFVGTAHPKKYKLINKMSQELKQIYPKQFIYFFLPSKLVYIYRKIKNIEFRNAKYKEFHFVPLSNKELDKILKNTNCILDSAQDGQNGLTIRTIEALGAQKKLITTNPNILTYDFYCEENIYVYSGEFDFNAKFFTNPYKPVDCKIYNQYTLHSWLNKLLDRENL